MKKIILASKSPRRSDLLEKYGIDFTISSKEIKEYDYNRDQPKEYSMSLAFQKAYQVALENQEEIVIGADTIISFRGEILEKPKDKKDAYKMLEKLSGNKHQVITGLAVVNLEDSIKVVGYEKTSVYFKDLEDETIKSYIKTGEPYGKAGSYAIQGIGGLLVDKIEGSYDNIVGLPVNKLEDILKTYFNMKIL